MTLIQSITIRLIALVVSANICWSLCADVMPEFSGDWFDSVVYASTKYDSCCDAHFEYVHKSSKDKLIDALIKTEPIEDCHWVGPKFDSYSDQYPEDFPAYRADVYNEIISRGGARSEFWKAECIHNRDPNYVVATRGAVIKPSYRCPHGSRSDCSDGSALCSYTSSCTADVLGRDLNQPPWSFAGHIGFMEFGLPSVIEALNEHPVLQVNKLSGFKKLSPYWGEVYGLDGSGFVDFYQAQAAVFAGKAQMSFNPEYTSDEEWREGSYTSRSVYDQTQNRFITERGIIRGKFRCDTFVIDCYLKGFNVRLPTVRYVKLIPRHTYNSFLFKRSENAPFDIKNTRAVSADSFQDRIQAYVNDENISHGTKVSYLWSLAQHRDVDEFSYLLDKLGAMSAYELVPEFINAYHNETQTEKKKKLITAIAYSVLSYAQRAHGEDTLISVDNTVIAQQFMIDLLRAQDPDLLEHGLWHALGILPMNHENYSAFCRAIDALQAKQRINDSQKFTVEVSMVFANGDMQESLLAELLSKQSNAGLKQVFNEKLLFIIRRLEHGDISQAIKPQLMDYLNAIEGAQYADVLYALATINSQNSDQRDKALARSIVNATTSQKQAEMVMSFDLGILSNLSYEEKTALRETFGHELGQDRLYVMALAKLN